MKNISEGCKWMSEPKNVFYAQNHVYSIRFKVRLFARILWVQVKQAYIGILGLCNKQFTTVGKEITVTDACTHLLVESNVLNTIDEACCIYLY